MKHRTLKQLQASKAIYRKHAELHKLNDYPAHRIKRMMKYTALVTKAIVKVGER